MFLQKRISELNQQPSRAVRPPLPRDGSANGVNKTHSGFVPPGFVGVWDFGNGAQTKMSPTSGGGKKVCGCGE